MPIGTPEEFLSNGGTLTKSSTAIVWIRNDFRLHDNQALSNASRFQRMLPVFIHDPNDSNPWQPGAASKWWLHHGLESFQKQLRRLGSDLVICKGAPHTELAKLAAETGAAEVLWNRSYNPTEAPTVAAVVNALKETGVTSTGCFGSLLCPPEDLLKKDGTPYQVYTPFWRNFVAKYQPMKVDAPRKLPPPPSEAGRLGVDIDELLFLPKIPWYATFSDWWRPGESPANRRLEEFLADGLGRYGTARDLPSEAGTSRLSPYLHFGEIHPQRVLWRIYEKFGDLKNITNPNIQQFAKEIVWREFSYHLLQHFPNTPTEPLKSSFKKFPWRRNERLFTAWTKGQTGYPIVDAGMRQLWATGWLHNRVRMIAGSFLVKHLGIPWQDGAKWFWDTLVDADLASNTQGWQWTAGCGADAQPFFRIFNPITQGEKFDARGAYAAKWCPELAKVPAKWIYRPWQAPKSELAKAGVILGDHYPKPIVDHDQARKSALEKYEKTRSG